MKKYLAMLLAFISFSVQCVYADDAVNIHIKMNGVTSDNRYFLCLPNVGCLSMLAAQRGKVFPLFHPLIMDNIYVLNTQTEQVSPQGLPASCNKTVNPNQTITISGSVSGSVHGVKINQLHCTIR